MASKRMIPPSPATRIFLSAQAVDLRRSFDGLCDLIRHHFQQDPLGGHLYVFTNKRRNRIKLLYADGSVLWLGESLKRRASRSAASVKTWTRSPLMCSWP